MDVVKIALSRQNKGVKRLPELAGVGEGSRLSLLNTPERQRENATLLWTAYQHWANLSSTREKRARVRDFALDDQWGDRVGGMTERDYIVSEGNYPAQFNVMQSLLKNVVGQFRTNQTRSIVIVRDKDKSEEEEILSNTLQACHDLNMAEELDAACIREKWISGIVVQKLGYEFWKNRDRSDGKMVNVETTRFFFNSNTRDVRTLDIDFCGELHDWSIGKLTSDPAICKNKEDEVWLKRIYSQHKGQLLNNMLNTKDAGVLDFFMPASPHLCRVIEVWFERSEWRTYEFDSATGEEWITMRSMVEVQQENAHRLAKVQEHNRQNPNHPIDEEAVPYIFATQKMEQIWYGRLLSPWGHVLWEGETPYAHQEHPYVLGLGAMVDGKIVSEGAQLIDIQKLMNRYLLLMDVAVKHGIKGVILVPEGCVPEGWKPNEYVQELKRMDGYVLYKTNPNNPAAIPTQLTSNSLSINNVLSGMAQQMQKMMSDVSGVHSAIQGKQPSAGTPASLYAQETQNASINTLDFFKEFSAFRERRDRKLLKILMQFYRTKRPVVTLTMTGDNRVFYDPVQLADLDTDVRAISGINAPMYKEIIDKDLRDMVLQGLIPLELWLKNSGAPYAKSLLADIDAMRQAVQAQGAPQENGHPPAPPAQE